MASNGHDLHQILQDLGITSGIIIALVGGITTISKRIRRKKIALIEQGKEIQAKNDEVKDLKQKIQNIELTLQKLEKRVDDNDEAIHCVNDEVQKAIGDVRESLARLDGAISKMPMTKKKS